MGRRSGRGLGFLNHVWTQGLGLARALWRFRLRSVSIAVALLAVAAGAAPAQTLSGAGGLLQQLQQTLQQGSSGASAQANQSQTQTLVAPTTPSVSTLPSRIERIFSDRAGVQLRQFGYSVFEGVSQITVPQIGAIQPYYVLGPGDQLTINLRGQESDTYNVAVDTDGNVVLPKLSPIHAAGKTFDEFESELRAAVKKAYISTDAFVSVGQMRRISVTVAGEVNAPGVISVTGLSTPMDALILAMGVKKSGSLRDIVIQRGGQQLHYDLYHVLMNDGEGSQIRLADGDKIVVPPLGHVVAVTGWVARPGIYEMAPGTRQMSIKELVRLGGGLQVRGAYRYSLMTTDAQGNTALVSLKGDIGTAHDDDILDVSPAASQRIGEIEFVGPTSLAGKYSLSRFSDLASLLESPGALGLSPYTLMGVISRKDPSTLQRQLIAFSPQDILTGRTNIALQSGDVVRVFDRAEAAMMANAVGIFTQRIDYLQAATTAIGTQAADNATSAATSALSGAVQQAIVATITPPQNLIGTPGQPMTAGAMPYQPSTTGAPQPAPYGAVQSGASQNGLQYGTGQPNTSQAVPSQYAGAQNPALQNLSPQSAAALQSMLGGAGNGQQQGAMQGYQPPGAVQPYQPQAGASALSPYQNSYQTPYGQPAPSQPFTLEDTYSSQGTVPITAEAPNVAVLGIQIGVDPAVLITFLADHRMSLLGNVRAPGIYVVGGTNSLADLVNAAGGTLNWTDLSSVDMIRTVADERTGRAKTAQVSLDLKTQTMASIDVMPRDTFRFNPIDTDVDQGSVVVQGDVRYPGTFDLVRGERLSDLLRRAGGLTKEAYPYGAVFLRKSVAQTEGVGQQRLADDAESQLITAIAQGVEAGAASRSAGSGAISSDLATFLQSYITRLRSTPSLGRMTVIADPAALAANPNSDVVLQTGDFLYVPDRPSSVSVTGQVLNPGSYTFQPSLSVDDYIQLAGGYGRDADDGNTFVVLPDGTTRAVDSGLFDFDSQKLPPGSVVVVPRDLTPLNYQILVSTMSDVFSNLAVSAASLSVISRNN
jgi:protein involved in polysaccharide export with SLBB domain